MRRTLAPLCALTLLALSVTSPFATDQKAPRSKDVMQPIDTRAGTFSDPNGLLRLNLDAPLSVNVASQPLLVVFNQLRAKMGADFGYEKGLKQEDLVTISYEGPARGIFEPLGRAGGLRFEAVGPLQIRVLRAGRTQSSKKPPTEPPPAKHPDIK